MKKKLDCKLELFMQAFKPEIKSRDHSDGFWKGEMKEDQRLFHMPKMYLMQLGFWHVKYERFWGGAGASIKTPKWVFRGKIMKISKAEFGLIKVWFYYCKSQNFYGIILLQKRRPRFSKGKFNHNCLVKIFNIY